MVTVESWFIPFDILMLVCIVLVILLSTLFLIIIAWDKACHTVPMMLTANSCVCALILGCVLMGMCVFTLKNDLQQIEYQDSLCVFRSYFIYSISCISNYSYLIQALYRYLIVVYPTHLFFQTAKFQLLCIFITWISGFLHPLAFIFTNDITYNVDNQICQIAIRPSFPLFYEAFYIYVIPVSMIVLIYLKLVRYVRTMNKRVIPANTLLRAQRELRMVQRTVILVTILLIIGFPYAIFVFMSIFTASPKYDFRIAYIFINVSLALVMITLFQFTDPLKAFILKKVRVQPITPVVTVI